MSIRINEDTNFNAGLRYAMLEEIDKSLSLLKTYKKPQQHLVVHEIRKSFKKIRAALRLVRHEYKKYHTDNKFFRDEARKISDLRDASSVIEALDKLYAKYDSQLYKHTFDKFRRFLLKRRAEYAKETLTQNQTLSSIEKNLQRKRNDFKNLDFHITKFDQLSPGKVYKRGEKAMLASKSLDEQDFHEWRKRVKYLRYQLEILNRIWPAMLTTWENELHKLSDLLGDDRDLFMLHQLTNEGHFKNDESQQLLESIIHSERIALQNNALLLGQRLYALPAQSFVKKLQTAWHTFENKAKHTLD